MSHSQLADVLFVQAEEGVLAGRRRAQACALKQERSKLVTRMQDLADRVNKVDSLLFLLDR